VVADSMVIEFEKNGTTVTPFVKDAQNLIGWPLDHGPVRR
jgi:hypothetical protein